MLFYRLLNLIQINVEKQNKNSEVKYTFNDNSMSVVFIILCSCELFVYPKILNTF